MGDIVKNLNNYNKVRDINLTKQDLIDFEEKIVSLWEDGQIRAPVHLSHGNEDELIEIFSVIDKDDYVFSTWRSHYHALLHGLTTEWIENKILEVNQYHYVILTTIFIHQQSLQVFYQLHLELLLD